VRPKCCPKATTDIDIEINKFMENIEPTTNLSTDITYTAKLVTKISDQELAKIQSSDQGVALLSDVRSLFCKGNLPSHVGVDRSQFLSEITYSEMQEFSLGYDYWEIFQDSQGKYLAWWNPREQQGYKAT
jgi:hypothetical protein